MNETVKKKFQAATAGLTLSAEQKRELAAFYADDLVAIEAMPQAMFTFLVRQHCKQTWGLGVVAQG